MSVAPASPNNVVFAGTRMCTRASCAAWDAARAFSWPPKGSFLSLPNGPAGSYIARNANGEYGSPVAGSGR